MDASDDLRLPGRAASGLDPRRLPRWLLGDWGTLIRDPVDLMRLALLFGAPITLAFGPREQSFRMLLTFLLTLIPRAIGAPRLFDFAFVTAMSFQAWGNVFGAFDGIYGYDKVVHFVLPCATSALLYLLLVRVRVVPDLAEAAQIRQRPAILLVTGAFGLALAGGLYELYEWFADNWLGAHLYTSYGDSIGDLTDDTIGALAGGGLILLWEIRGWGTRRLPLPRGRRAEDEDPVAEVGDAIVDRLQPGSGGGIAAETGRGAPGTVPRAALYGVGIALLAAALAAPFVGGFEGVGGFGPAPHFVLSAAAAPFLYLAVVRLRLFPRLDRGSRLHAHAALALAVFSLGFSAGILYEIYSYVAGHAMDYPQLIAHLSLDVLGALAGAALVLYWNHTRDDGG
jgi:hypothetical protein